MPNKDDINKDNIDFNEGIKQESYVINSNNLNNMTSCEYIEFDVNKPIPELIIPDNLLPLEK